MKKIIIVIGIIILVVSIFLFIVFNFSTESGDNVENMSEIQPEEEISDEQMQETNIKLYFADTTSGVLTPESRWVSAKELIDNPYLYVVNLLVQGPKIDGLSKVIPNGTKINSAKLDKGTLSIDLSEEFLNGSGTEAIYSIVNTVSEFNDVQNVKFTINGETKDGIKDKFVKKE